MNMNEVEATAFNFTLNHISEKSPGELGRYIAGIGDVSPTFIAFVVALKSYSDVEKQECFDEFAKAAALYEENF